MQVTKVRFHDVWTNAGYALAGIFGFFFVGGPFAFPFLIACICLAVGSTIYHAEKWSKTEEVGRLMDEIGMYFVFSHLAFMAWGGKEIEYLIMMWLFLALFAYIIDSFKMLGLLGCFIVGGLIHEGQYLGLLISLLLFGSAFALWHMDNDHHTSWYHSIWHILTAIMIGYLFFLFS